MILDTTETAGVWGPISMTTYAYGATSGGVMLD